MEPLSALPGTALEVLFTSRWRWRTLRGPLMRGAVRGAVERWGPKVTARTRERWGRSALGAAVWRRRRRALSEGAASHTSGRRVMRVAAESATRASATAATPAELFAVVVVITNRDKDGRWGLFGSIDLDHGERLNIFAFAVLTQVEVFANGTLEPCPNNR
jgi:hypothetical protein